MNRASGRESNLVCVCRHALQEEPEPTSNSWSALTDLAAFAVCANSGYSDTGSATRTSIPAPDNGPNC